MSNKSEKPEISNAEFDVLDVIWDDSPVTANEVIERLNQRKNWHDKTVKTLLGRLVKKEVLSFEKQQRQYLLLQFLFQVVQKLDGLFPLNLYKHNYTILIRDY